MNKLAPPTAYTMIALFVALMLGMAATSVPAQTANDNKEAEIIEEISVVGSRIRRKDAISVSPVQTLGEEDLRIDGSLSIGETLQKLPAVGPSLNSNGSAGTSHGASSLNLRNLGPNRSLVLVNGHRWVNGAGTRGFRDFVDLNTVPQVMIERVEVLQDGATAIYGADAIAGVVNMHTYRDFEGARLETYYGSSAEGDRDTKGVDILLGKTFGSSNWTVALGWVDEEPIYTQDRALTAIPLNGLTYGTPEGIFRETNLEGVLPFPYPSQGITRDPGVDGSVVANWRPADTVTDRFNRYYNNYTVGPMERTSVFVQNTTQFDSGVTFSLEALYNERKSDQLFSINPPRIRGSRGFTIAADPQVNPFGVEFSGSDFRMDNFFPAIGQRDNVQDVDTTRIGLGLAGEFSNGWAWDGFLSWAENEATFTSVNQIHLDKLALGMLNCNAAGISSDVSDLLQGCVPVNMFVPMTQEVVDYVRYSPVDYNKAEQLDFTFNTTGELIDMPAGPLAFAAGIEYREEKGLDRQDAIATSSPRVNTYRTTTSAPRDGTEGRYDLSEAYAEFDMPLLMNRASIEELRVQAAVRYSNYSTFGSTTNAKIGALLRPSEDVMLRATWAEGFRAPSILELFEGLRSTSIPVVDPCSGGGGGPGCAGVPADYVQQSPNVPATVGGNPDLEPETSENISLGLVWTPAWLEGASATIDWYSIDIDDTISAYGAQDLLDLCSTTGQRCNFIQRDSTGEIINIADGPINLNRTEVEGVDLVVRYAHETRFGSLDYTLLASRLLDLTQESRLSDGTILVEDKVGTAASRESFPEWRALFMAKLINDRWSGYYSLRFIGDTTEFPGGEPNHIESVAYHNLSGSYHFNDAFSLRLGVDNVLDKQPPESFTNLNINFDISTYSAVGRFYYAQLTWGVDL